jgi:NitT/TauT family transport system ATP-binding protein
MRRVVAAVLASTLAARHRLWWRYGVTIVFITHDIDEAVYLGGRVLVLSSSPTELMDDVAAGLPEQRDQLTTRSSPVFARLRGHVFQQAKGGAR